MIFYVWVIFSNVTKSDTVSWIVDKPTRTVIAVATLEGGCVERIKWRRRDIYVPPTHEPDFELSVKKMRVERMAVRRQATAMAIWAAQPRTRKKRMAKVWIWLNTMRPMSAKMIDSLTLPPHARDCCTGSRSISCMGCTSRGCLVIHCLVFDYRSNITLAG